MIMKLFRLPKQEYRLVRINIKEGGTKTLHSFTVDCPDIHAVKAWAEDILHPHAGFASGKRTTIECREYFVGIGKTVNGKAVSFAMYGKTPGEVYDLLIEKID